MTPSGTTRSHSPHVPGPRVREGHRSRRDAARRDQLQRGYLAAEVARMMSTYRIHCVVVFDLEGERPGAWSRPRPGRRGRGGRDELVRAVASTELVTVTAEMRTATRAAQLLTEHQVAISWSHAGDGHPVGAVLDARRGRRARVGRLGAPGRRGRHLRAELGIPQLIAGVVAEEARRRSRRRRRGSGWPWSPRGRRAPPRASGPSA